jgi:xylan 1,4-beta-xylosidase
MRHWLPLTASAALALAIVTSAPAADAFPVTIRVDAAKPMGELRPIWRFFGADEPNSGRPRIALRVANV